ncbi:MAG: PaaX family transcriptional regulator C-terminal domain-containing protein [Acidimicrobiales bacterium]
MALSARSIVASTLLGTTPPRLPSRLLVAFAEEFGVAPGTTRVALSRMVERGELIRDDDGTVALSGELLDRQGRQEEGLAPHVRPWTGDWEMYLVRDGGRESSERAALRRAATHLGLREHREGVWLRPDNLDPERQRTAREVVDAQCDRFAAAPADPDPVGLAASLFELADWAAEAERCRARMTTMAATLEFGRPGALADGFETAAHSLRHLVSDPRLPDELCPAGWPAPALRRDYHDYNERYRQHLSAFFRSRSRLAG